MYGCLTSAKYHSYADVMEVVVTQNPATKEISRTWTVTDTFMCDAQSIKSEGASDTANNKKFNKEYSEEQRIKVLSKKKLNKRQRITNLADKDGNAIWTVPGISGEPSIFEIASVSPLFDMFGNVMEYEIMAKEVFTQNGE
jgi:hypothetical protein